MDNARDALAGLLAFDPLYDIRTIRMSIVQPRLNNTSSFEIAPDDRLGQGVDDLLHHRFGFQFLQFD